MGFFSNRTKKERDKKILQDEVSLGANAQNLYTGSEAAREWVKAYSGKDRGTPLAKGLESISQEKIHPDYKFENIHQQAGFASEVMEVAEINSKNIRTGKTERAIRTDDLGRVNDPFYDIAIVDGNGNITDQYQMKYVGASRKDPNNLETPRRIAKKLESYDKYGDIAIQPENYEKVLAELDKDIKEAEKRLEAVSQSNNPELIAQKQGQLEKLKNIKKGLRSGQVTEDAAVNARVNPLATTTKKIAKESVLTGAECAATSAAITGAMSLVRNMKSYMNGEIDGEEAAKEIGKDVAVAGASGFGTGVANTALASILKNSGKEFAKKLGESSAPAQVVSFGVSAIRILQDRSEGKITDTEVVENLTKAGVGTVGTFAAGSWGQAAGVALGKHIGGKVGGVVGSVGGPLFAIACSLVAGIVIDNAMDYAIDELKKPIYARQEREQIEAQCAAMRQELENYRNEFKATYIAHTEELKSIFGNSLAAMAEALKIGDADAFLGSADNMIEALGGKSQFGTVKEFEKFLVSEEAFEL